MKRVISAAVAAAFLLGMSACGDDDKSSNPFVTDANGSDDGASGDNGSDDNGGVTVPNIPGVDSQCESMVAAMGFAAAAMSGQGDRTEMEAAFESFVSAVPADLADDAAIYATAFTDYLTVIAAHQGDANPMASPDVMAALQALTTPEVQAAADNISEYIDASCPNG